MDTPHRVVRVSVSEDQLVGLESVLVQVVAGGQASNVVAVPIAAPNIAVVDIYDTTESVPARRTATATVALNTCDQVVTNPAAQTVVQVRGLLS